MNKISPSGNITGRASGSISGDAKNNADTSLAKKNDDSDVHEIKEVNSNPKASKKEEENATSEKKTQFKEEDEVRYFR